MFVSETTATVGIEPCPVCDIELLARDKFAGITTVDVAANLAAATSGMQMTTLSEADKLIPDVRAFHGYQPFLTTSAQAGMQGFGFTLPARTPRSIN